MTSPISSTAGKHTLAIDTSGARGSLALGKFQVAWEKKAIHSEIATVQLRELLDSAGMDLKEISRIAVNTGPGSFTGIRVGVNLARTLAYALSIPVGGFNSLALLSARAARPGETVFTAIKAIQNFYYCAAYAIGAGGIEESLAPCSMAESELERGAKGYTKVQIEGQSASFTPQLEANVMLECLVRWPEQADFSSWKELKPVYVRASEAEEKLLKGLLKT